MIWAYLIDLVVINYLGCIYYLMAMARHLVFSGWTVDLIL